MTAHIWTVIANTYPALLAYMGVMYFFYVFLNTKGVDPIKKPLITAAYYSVATYSALFLFSHEVAHKIIQITPYAAASLVLLFLILLLLPQFIRSSKKLLHTSQKHPNVYFLQIGYAYVFGKSFEIFFQQIIILALSIRLGYMFPEMTHVIFAFGLLFSFLHLPVLFRLGIKFGALFIIAPALSAFVFPVLILGLEGGFIFSYSIHWMFYVMAAVVNTESILFKKRKRNKDNF